MQDEREQQQWEETRQQEVFLEKGGLHSSDRVVTKAWTRGRKPTTFIFVLIIEHELNFAAVSFENVLNGLKILLNILDCSVFNTIYKNVMFLNELFEYQIMLMAIKKIKDIDEF